MDPPSVNYIKEICLNQDETSFTQKKINRFQYMKRAKKMFFLNRIKGSMLNQLSRIQINEEWKIKEENSLNIHSFTFN